MKKLVVKIGGNIAEDLDSIESPRQIRDSPDNVVYFQSAEQFASILSAKKIELLQYLSEVTGQTVTKIAIELHRKKEAVSRDLHQLEALGFIQMQKQGKKVYPKAKYQAIQINLKATA